MDPYAGLLEAAVRIAVPILLAVLGEIVAERAGVLNLGLEGMMLSGAFAAWAVASAAGSAGPGVAAGILAGAALAALFAGLVVRLAFEPVVSGIALNILAAGVTVQEKVRDVLEPRAEGLDQDGMRRNWLRRRPQVPEATAA